MPTDRVKGSLPAFASVLAVCAHPDDESFGLGGVLDYFASNNAQVSMLCFTHGEASTLGVSFGALHRIRAAELAAAAAVLRIRHYALFDFPDGALDSVPLEELASKVRAAAEEVVADLVVVFDENGITGHRDHCRATEAALLGVPELPMLGWSLPKSVAEILNEELGTVFLGREDDEIDVVIEVDRRVQRRAIVCHASQCTDNFVLWRRLGLLGEREALRWLRPPSSEGHSFTSDGNVVE